jgi:hypothetical protein
VVSTILTTMVAMPFTAIKYGRMARVSPSAGSAYTYVGKTLHPMLGYLVGWSMLMDYLLNPIICAIWCGAAAQDLIPQVPHFAWASGFVVLFTVIDQKLWPFQLAEEIICGYGLRASVDNKQSSRANKREQTLIGQSDYRADILSAIMKWREAAVAVRVRYSVKSFSQESPEWDTLKLRSPTIFLLICLLSPTE